MALLTVSDAFPLFLSPCPPPLARRYHRLRFYDIIQLNSLNSVYIGKQEGEGRNLNMQQSQIDFYYWRVSLLSALLIQFSSKKAYFKWRIFKLSITL